MAVLGPSFPSDAQGVLAFVDGMSQIIDDVAAVSGRGVQPDVYDKAFSPAVGRINTPTYSAALVDEWIAGLDGAVEALRQGRPYGSHCRPSGRQHKAGNPSEAQARSSAVRTTAVQTNVGRSATFLAWLAGDYHPRGPVDR